MKTALAAVALLFACGPLQAQTLFEKPKPAAPAEKKKEKSAETTTTKPDKARPAEPQHGHHSGHPAPKKERPAQERQTSEGPVKLDRARPAETQRPSSPPSPAQQMQQQQYEQRQQQSQPSTAPSTAARVVQCNARPVCGGGGYGRCAAVAQTYQGGTLQAGRRAIVQSCIEANTPDSCNCAGQCAAVARCTIF